MELERIYGIRQGSANENGDNKIGDLNNSNDQMTQKDLAEQLQIDQSQLINYKKLNDLIPEIQSLIESGSMKATVGYKIWAKMPQEEQEKFFNEIGRDRIKTLTQKATEEYINHLLLNYIN